MVNGSFISRWRISKEGMRFKIQERKFIIFPRGKIHFSFSENFRSEYKPCFICFSLLKFCCSAERWESLFSKEWEDIQGRQSAAFLLWFLGKIDYRNSLNQGKNSPRPQHYGCVSRISLGPENAESKASCLWGGHAGKAEHPVRGAQSLQLPPEAQQEARCWQWCLLLSSSDKKDPERRANEESSEASTTEEQGTPDSQIKSG